MSRRTWHGPLERVCMPWIVFGHAAARKDAHEEIEDEDQLGCAENESGNGDEDIQRLLRLQERVLSRIIQPAHLSADAENVHREEDTIDAHKAEPKMNFAESFVHQSAEHFREPEVKTPKSREQRSDSHYEMEVRNDEIGVL